MGRSVISKAMNWRKGVQCGTPLEWHLWTNERDDVDLEVNEEPGGSCLRVIESLGGNGAKL